MGKEVGDFFLNVDVAVLRSVVDYEDVEMLDGVVWLCVYGDCKEYSKCKEEDGQAHAFSSRRLWWGWIVSGGKRLTAVYNF